MTTLKTELKKALPEWRARLSGYKPAPRLEYVGTVINVGDGVAEVEGLPRTRLNELLRFEDGTFGLAFRVSADKTGCVLLGADNAVKAGTHVSGTGSVIRVPVGDALLGRVVDPMGLPLDEQGPVEAEDEAPIERPAPAIVDREQVTSPLMTGITAIDAMVPVGRGQRELIIGDRKTGKTAIAVDTIINQRNSDVLCVYVAVGQKASTVAQVVEAVKTHGRIERCLFIVAESETPPGAQWIAPYSACTMAEHFRDRGKDVLLVIDDLSKHAILYRQLSLLLRRPPGREAYPGDIFHIHARLLERAAKLSDDLGGGSLTALPIAETQDGDLASYIPTNLISITDGQIYLEPKLFYEGQKPAVNVGLSVSRVGGQTQPPAIRSIAEKLRLEYAQFLELEAFSRFGAMTDEHTKQAIEHGRRIRAILSQNEYAPRSLLSQLALLLLVDTGRLDTIPLALVDKIKDRLPPYLADRCPALSARLGPDQDLADEDRADLLKTLDHLLADMGAKLPPKAR